MPNWPYESGEHSSLPNTSILSARRPLQYLWDEDSATRTSASYKLTEKHIAESHEKCRSLQHTTPPRMEAEIEQASPEEQSPTNASHLSQTRS